MNNTVKGMTFVVVILAIVAGAYFTLANDNVGGKLVNSQNVGVLNLYVYDAPSPAVSAVYITFTTVSLHENFGFWQNFSLGSKTVNVLNLSSANATLLKGLSLTPQEYGEVGLQVTKVVATVGGANETFALASKSIYVTHTFSIVTNKTTNVNIQIDLESDLNLQTKVFTPNIGSTFTTGTKGTQDNGTLNFYTYDKPSENVSAVYLTFSNVSLHGVQTGWENYSIPNETINILNLSQSNASLLQSLSLSPQEYTMVRLYIQQVNVTLNGVNETFRLAAPFALINHPFNVSSNGTTELYIQFNLAHDINTHALIFTPNVGTTFTTTKG